MQEWYLGWEMSCLERCPQFRSVLIGNAVHFTTACLDGVISCSNSFL